MWVSLDFPLSDKAVFWHNASADFDWPVKNTRVSDRGPGTPFGLPPEGPSLVWLGKVEISGVLRARKILKMF